LPVKIAPPKCGVILPYQPPEIKAQSIRIDGDIYKTIEDLMI